MEGRYNTRSPAVKRLMREAQELSEPTEQYYAQPLEDNLFEWHFTVRGPADSDFQDGVYHGRIILPVDYPMKPPSIIWLTPNGRFETNKKICLSISGHHPESWQPSWSIRTALLAIIGFMPTRPGGAIGSLDYTPEERRVLAKKSQDWKCPVCGSIKDILLPREQGATVQPSKEAQDLAAQIQFEGEKPKCKAGECPITASVAAGVPSATSSAAAASSSSTSTAATSATTTTSVTNDQQAQQANQPQPVVTNTGPAWTYPPLGMPAGSPGFPPVMAWPGLAPVGPTPGGPLAMLPRFPLPPSQQPPGAFPIQCFPSGFPPLPQGAMPMFPMPPPPYHQVFPQTPATNPGVTSTATATPTTAPVATPAATAPPVATASPTIASSMNPSMSCQEKPQASASNVAADSQVVGAQSLFQSTNKTPHHNNSFSGISGEGGTDSELGGDRILPSEASAEPGVKEENDNLSPSRSAAGHGTQNLSSKEEVGDLTGSRASPAKHGGDGTEQSQPDLPADDNSDSNIPPLDFSEAEQRSSYLERSVSSSMPDLEKQSKSPTKGLRHRQSATATVPAEEEEGAQSGAEAAGQAGAAGGQRIEAASGDTYPQLVRPMVPPRAFAEARQAHRHAIARSTQQRHGGSSYDGSYIAMLVLSVATALILLNRLVQMVDWSVLH